MKITSEADILNEATRAAIITEIEAPENKRRKHEFYKRYKIHKDSTYQYVLEKMMALFDPITVGEMSYAIANISIGKKIVNKLARVYSNGVTREVFTDEESKTVDEEATKQISKLEEYFSINSQMKKC